MRVDDSRRTMLEAEDRLERAKAGIEDAQVKAKKLREQAKEQDERGRDLKGQLKGLKKTVEDSTATHEELFEKMEALAKELE